MATDVEVIIDKNTVHKQKGRKRSTIIDMARRNNPLTEQIRDTGEIEKLFKLYPLVPFSGTNLYTGHVFLDFLLNMRNLSTTQGACINSIKKFVLGNKLDIVRNTDSLFELSEEEFNDEPLKRKFSEFIKGIKINMTNFKFFNDAIFDDYKSCGNGWHTLAFNTSLGQKSVAINYYSPKECIYIATEDNEDKLVAISPCWDYNYIKKYPPKLIPLYPNFVKDENGDMITMRHLKNGPEWYGRPDSLSSFQYQYREFQDVDYLTKEADMGFTGKVLIETEAGEHDTEDPSKKNGFDTILDRWEDSYTQKSNNPTSLLIFERPFEATPALVHEFKPNTNEKFYDTTSKISERKIILSHAWSAMLLGESKSTGFDGNAFMDELKTKLPVIQGYQLLLEEHINLTLQLAMEFLGLSELNGLGIKYKTPYEIIKDEVTDNGLRDSPVRTSSEDI